MYTRNQKEKPFNYITLVNLQSLYISTLTQKDFKWGISDAPTFFEKSRRARTRGPCRASCTPSGLCPLPPHATVRTLRPRARWEGLRGRRGRPSSAASSLAALVHRTRTCGLTPSSSATALRHLTGFFKPPGQHVGHSLHQRHIGTLLSYDNTGLISDPVMSQHLSLMQNPGSKATKGLKWPK